MEIATAAKGLVVGYQLPKSGTAGYVVITGTTKSREAEIIDLLSIFFLVDRLTLPKRLKYKIKFSWVSK